MHIFRPYMHGRYSVYLFLHYLPTFTYSLCLQKDCLWQNLCLTRCYSNIIIASPPCQCKFNAENPFSQYFPHGFIFINDESRHANEKQKQCRESLHDKHICSKCHERNDDNVQSEVKTECKQNRQCCKAYKNDKLILKLKNKSIKRFTLCQVGELKGFFIFLFS